MNKLFFIVLFAIAYVIYSKISDLESIGKKLGNQIENLNAFNRTLKDKVDIKDSEIELQKAIVKKQLANYEAFNGTDCVRCHLDSKLMLPLDNHFIDAKTYISHVRYPSNHNPLYENKPTKTSRDITDSELRRQYKILQGLYENIKAGV